jgi:hypothetical protein
MAGGGATPRVGYGAVREDPWTVLVADDDDIILKKNSEL